MSESKKVLIVAPGSRGDVGPYHGMGVRLREAGHHVVFASYGHYREMVESTGLEFYEIAGDAREDQGSELMQHWQDADSGAKKAVDGLRAAQGVVREFHEQGMEMVAAAEQDVDVMIPSLLAIVGFMVAESLDIASVEAFVGPTQPTGAFPPPVLGIGRSLGRFGNRGLYTLIDKVARRTGKDPLAKLRADLGLPPEEKPDPAKKRDVYYGYSPELLPKPKDWPDGSKVVGFWWPATTGGWEPPAELVDFLDAGPPPVFISFGSNAGEGRGEMLSGIVTEALRKAGVRGIVQAGWAGLEVSGDDLLTVRGEINYDWLLPRTSAAVHHSGVGTIGAVLRAGIPHVPVPAIADQPFWAGQLVRIGVSPAVVPFAKLTADRLGDAIKAAVSNPAYRQRAETVAARVAEEDGAAHIVEAVNQIA
ncbi:glycosyltransferase [Amycolatopsis sp. CA-230715]|uniref:glycosyltransferase n=1 Tax=Amycolatopsis sp. CA-230715 TaxID=2745196 RepID=UPI001C00F323|nr:glycosyltransferase [Amycolatopsis sp. CA-230715]QWF84161.1 O-mycaminosyltylonolide 6-deoxyallosyltransferase [Amycolatopsis sp. CA-230715]